MRMLLVITLSFVFYLLPFQAMSEVKTLSCFLRNVSANINFNLNQIDFGCKKFSLEIDFSTGEYVKRCSGNEFISEKGIIEKATDKNVIRYFFNRAEKYKSSNSPELSVYPGGRSDFRPTRFAYFQLERFFRGSRASLTGHCSYTGERQILPFEDLNQRLNLGRAEAPSNIEKTTTKETHSIIKKYPAENKLNVKSTKLGDNCSKLQSKLNSHIEDENYEKALAAEKLIKQLNCYDTNRSELSKNNSINRQSSELTCNVGPLGKNGSREFGKYRAKSFDSNPSKDCLATYEICKVKSKAIADATTINVVSRKTKKNYSASCRTMPVGSLDRTSCTIFDNTPSGGFAAGFFQGLARNNKVAQAKRDIYVSNFKVCMAEMGYSLTKR